MFKRRHFGALLIFAVCTLLSILIWAFFAVQIRHERDDAINAQARHNANLAMIFAEQAVTTVQDVDGLLMDMRRAYHDKGRALRLEDVPVPLSVAAKALVYRAIIDEDGRVAIGSLIPEPVNVADREYFKSQKSSQADDLVVGTAVLGRTTGRPTVHVSRRINKPGGGFGGVAVAGLDPTIFTKLYQKVEMGKSGQVTFVGFDGLTRARRLGSVVSFGDDSSKSPNFQKIVAEREQAPSGSMFVKSAIDGVERVFSFKVIPSLSMVVVVGTASEEALAAATTRARRYTLTAAGASLLFLLLAFVLSAAYIRQRRHTWLLAESEARYRGTFDQAAVGISHTTLDGRFIRANGRLASMLGWSPETLREAVVADVTHPLDLAVVSKLRRDLLLMPDLSGQLVTEFRLLHKSGAVVWASLASSIACKPDGSPDYLISVIQNITARRLAQQEIERLNHELEQRVEARTRDLKEANKRLEAFSYSVSHDLRGPLTTIDGFSGLLQRREAVKTDESALALVGHVRAGVAKMSLLIDGLLSLATLPRAGVVRKPVDLTAIAKSLLKQAAQTNPERTVEVGIQEGMVVQADNRLMNSMMANLIGNAWKFTSKTKLARIEVGCQPGLDGLVVFFVRDNGAGFDMAHAGELFGAFQRLHTASEFQGTGIGLAIVKQIIEMHQGEIWVEAKPELGATFYFTIGTDDLQSTSEKDCVSLQRPKSSV
ncbi:ATP-binding protein [Polaromonas sp. UC242_47]|uniref:ATP-binding protein n=1 Tax=Polaromonas sp. UC242_47 TaxID=3374626 RepID=UPI0037B8A7F3